ncbi:NADH pyrophosphatase, partial [Haemophilus influenzae]
NKKSSLFR